MALPNPVFNEQEIVLSPGRGFSPGVTMAMDIGGTLAKFVYVERCHCQARNRKCACFSDENPDVTSIKLKLATFNAKDIDALIDFVHDVFRGHGHCSLNSQLMLVNSTVNRLRATGVGCVLHRQRIMSSLTEKEIEFHYDDRELDHSVNGICLLWRHLPVEELLYAEFSDITGLVFQTELKSSGALPCLVVNMGSALTIVQVEADGKVAGIVGGSSQGGMTFLGLGQLLTKATSFDELMSMASRGRCQEVDLTVNDVAGMEYNCTASDVIVSSFGKVARRRALDPDAVFLEEDLAASLMYCIIDEMVKTVYLVSKAQNVKMALFSGSFFASNKAIMNHVRRKIQVCVSYLGHEVCPVFLQHQSYLGAIGLLAT